jgi:hypothetical protein
MFVFSLWCRNWVSLLPNRIEGWGTGNCYSPSGEISTKRRGKNLFIKPRFLHAVKIFISRFIRTYIFGYRNHDYIPPFSWTEITEEETEADLVPLVNCTLALSGWGIFFSFFFISFTVLSKRRNHTRASLKLSLTEDFSRIYRLLEKIKFLIVPIRSNWEDHRAWST